MPQIDGEKKDISLAAVCCCGGPPEKAVKSWPGEREGGSHVPSHRLEHENETTVAFSEKFVSRIAS